MANKLLLTFVMKSQFLFISIFTLGCLRPPVKKTSKEIDIARWKKPIWKGFQLYDILKKVKLWKQKKMWLLGVGVGEMNRQSRECLGQWKRSVYYNDGYVTILLFKPIQSTSSEPYGKLQIYRLWVIMMYQCTFIHSILKKKVPFW